MTITHVCYGVGKDFTCKFDGACYGEICIDPGWCSKKVCTPEDLAKLNEIRASLGMDPYEGEP